MATQYVTKEDLSYAAQVQKGFFVKKEDGKGLSHNDLTDELKAQYDNAVQQEAGKGLSTNDLTDELKAQYDEAVQEAVRKEEGKGLSTNDLTDELKAQYDNAVQKEEGKGLSQNDLTHELKQKYDETASTVEGLVATGGQPNVIETVKLNGVALDPSNKAVNIEVITEGEVDNKIKSAVAGSYKVKGSIAFASLPSEGVEAGWIYNVSDAFTTTDKFAEGAGVEYPAGTNVVFTEDGKWDCMAGTYDFSGFVMKEDIAEITEEEINAMYNG